MERKASPLLLTPSLENERRGTIIFERLRDGTISTSRCVPVLLRERPVRHTRAHLRVRQVSQIPAKLLHGAR